MADVAPVIALHVVPPFVDFCHWYTGVVYPDATVLENVTALPIHNGLGAFELTVAVGEQMA